MTIVILFLMILVSSITAEIPSFFRGSPELFSGFLPNSERFVESFKFTKGLEIEGNSTQVEMILAESNQKGRFYIFCKFDVPAFNVLY